MTRSSRRAVVWLDRHQLLMLHLHDESVHAVRFHSRDRTTGPYAAYGRFGHEFHARVCDALQGTEEVLVTGTLAVLESLQCYIERYCKPIQSRIRGYSVLDVPTDHQLAAIGRVFFQHRDAASAAAVLTP